MRLGNWETQAADSAESPAHGGGGDRWHARPGVGDAGRDDGRLTEDRLEFGLNGPVRPGVACWDIFNFGPSEIKW